MTRNDDILIKKDASVVVSSRYGSHDHIWILPPQSAKTTIHSASAAVINFFQISIQKSSINNRQSLQMLQTKPLKQLIQRQLQTDVEIAEL